MYELLKTTSFPIFQPIVRSPGGQQLAVSVMNLLKGLLVDFKCYVYTSDQPTPITAFLVQIRKLSSSELLLNFKLIFSDNVSADLPFSIVSNNDEYYRMYYDTSDAVLSEELDPNTIIPTFEGYLTVSKSETFLAQIPTVSYAGLQIPIEPACFSVVTQHKVDQIQCQYAKPLYIQSTQTPESNYTNLSTPLTGHLKFKPGMNCAITLQPTTNSIIIAAQRNANDSPEEVCGIWADPVSPTDALCSEGIYAISGVAPDSSGNVNIKAELPLISSIISSATVQQTRFSNLASSYSYVNNFIYVGLPETADNGSVFNCI
jgi:hypothetical protein